jgi:hypothetical protein
LDFRREKIFPNGMNNSFMQRDAQKVLPNLTV